MSGTTRRRLPSAAWAAIAACAVFSGGADAGTLTTFREPFESGSPSWQTPSRTGQVEQRRQRETAREGAAAELVALTLPGDQPVRLVHPIPASGVASEPTAAVWVSASRPGVRLALRLRLPNQIDPLTGQPVTCLLSGDALTEPRRWQRLEVSAEADAIKGRLRRLRAELATRVSGPIDDAGLQVDAVVLTLIGSGRVSLVTDDLVVGPLMAAAPIPNATARQSPPLQVQGGRATIDGRPFFPLATLDDGESIDTLRDSGMNLAWVDDYTDRERTQALRQAGLGVIARPEYAYVGDEVADPSVATPRPLDEASEDVLMWMLDFRIRGEEFEQYRRRIGQIEASDRLYDQPRPIAADVLDRSRAFSRRLSVVGASEQILHTGREPWEYYLSLGQARHAALPGSLHMTWIPTEPAPLIAAARRPGSTAPVVEPEQIWMQAQLALAAGYNGLGFWKRTPLDGDAPGAAERRLAIRLLAMRLRLVERWLAGGELTWTVPVNVGTVEQSDDPFAARSAVGTPHPRLRAAVIRSGEGMLILPFWLPDAGQHVPGPMAARNTRIKVNGWHNLHCWEVTTTGLRILRLREVAGGSEIELGDVDQNAVILLTSQTFLPQVNELQRELRAMRSEAAAAWVELASAKADRVRDVVGQLDDLTVPRPQTTDSRMGAAQVYLERAAAAERVGDCATARRDARLAMQSLRIVQRSYWSEAVADLPAATASPHTVCFQTLPDHYRMVAALRNRPLLPQVASSSLTSDQLADAAFQPVPGGSFDDAQDVDAAGWRRIPVARDDVLGSVDLKPVDKVPTIVQTSDAPPTGRALCLRSRPASARAVDAAPIAGRTMVIESPTLAVDAGDAIELTARVLVTAGCRGLIYDEQLAEGQKLGGPLMAVPIVRTDQWQTIRLMRQAPNAADVTFRFELHGCGEMLIDDVRLRQTRQPLGRPAPVTPLAAEMAADPEPEPKSLLRRLPLWPKRDGRGDESAAD